MTPPILKKPDSWPYYQCNPTKLRADKSVRKLPGITIAILKVFHDLLWMKVDKQLLHDQNILTDELDMEPGIIADNLEKLISCGALYLSDGYIRSPYIDDIIRHCNGLSEKRSKAVQSRYNTVK